MRPSLLALVFVLPALSSATSSPPPCMERRVDRKAIGAWYHKVVTDTAVENLGITGTGVLPVPSFDPSRWAPTKYPVPLDPAAPRVPLDRPSVYFGGHAGGRESDVGLSWDRVYEGASPVYTAAPDGVTGGDATQEMVIRTVRGAPALVRRSDGEVVAQGKDAVAAAIAALRPAMAFRPFWRTTNGENRWNNPPLDATNVYFQPGERITMTVEVVGPETLRMTIAGENGKRFTRTFTQKGFRPGAPTSFKRVNSIDQTGQERTPAAATKSTALGGRWDRVDILRTGGKKEPLDCAHGTLVKGGDTAGRYGEVFDFTEPDAMGGSRVDIRPSGPPLVPESVRATTGSNVGRNAATRAAVAGAAASAAAAAGAGWARE